MVSAEGLILVSCCSTLLTPDTHTHTRTQAVISDTWLLLHGSPSGLSNESRVLGLIRFWSVLIRSSFIPHFSLRSLSLILHLSIRPPPVFVARLRFLFLPPLAD